MAEFAAVEKPKSTDSPGTNAIVYVGPSKTGSTTIQYMAEEMKSVLKEEDYEYFNQGMGNCFRIGVNCSGDRFLAALEKQTFEHSLVDELGYTGYERLRRGFDRAFGGSESVPTFSLVVDAGCGTNYMTIGNHFKKAPNAPKTCKAAQEMGKVMQNQSMNGNYLKVAFYAIDEHLIEGDLSQWAAKIKNDMRIGNLDVLSKQMMNVHLKINCL